MAASPTLMVTPAGAGTIEVEETIEETSGRYGTYQITKYYPTVQAAAGFRFSHLNVKVVHADGEVVEHDNIGLDLYSLGIWTFDIIEGYEGFHSYYVTVIEACFVSLATGLILRSATSGKILRGALGRILHDW